MKSNELMIGDHVSHFNEEKNCVVTELRGRKVAVSYTDDNGDTKYSELLPEMAFEPIPLTPGILEKNGFTRGEYKSYTGDVWYLKEEGFRKIGLTMSGKESTLWGEKIKPTYPDSIGHKFSVPNIKFVHELQHALRLCGISKEIDI